MVDISLADKPAVVRIYGSKTSVFVFALDFRDFVRIDPAMPRDNALFLILFKINLVCRLLLEKKINYNCKRI